MKNPLVTAIDGQGRDVRVDNIPTPRIIIYNAVNVTINATTLDQEIIINATGDVNIKATHIGQEPHIMKRPENG